MAEIIVTQKRKKNKHILKEDRKIIERMLFAGVQEAQIIHVIGCTRRTYRREMERGRCEQMDSELRKYYVYSAELAQRKHEAAARNKGRYPKLNNNPALRKFIEKKIKKDLYSPDTALMKVPEENELRRERGEPELVVDITTKTVYNSIDRGDINVTRKELLRKEGWKHKKSKPRNGYHTKGKSIDERPREANERLELGHLEGDLVVSGKNGSGAILTLTDRTARQEIIVKLKSKEQSEVTAALDRLERGGLAAKWKTITFDNGSEFLDFRTLQTSVNGGERFEVYYAHPYSSWERGTNENHNGMIRRFFPKGTDFSKVSQRKLAKIQDWMNNYPRRKLGCMSPNRFAESFT
jgi:IS30 family transposase